MYQIKKIPNFYGMSYSYEVASLLADNNNILEFSTPEEAQEKIDEEEAGVYVLRNNEADRPHYEIINDYDYGPDCIKGSLEFESDDIPGDIVSKLDRLGVEFDTVYGDNEHEIWSAHISTDDCVYGIHYIVSACATQLHADDLGNINWSCEVYSKENL